MPAGVATRQLTVTVRDVDQPSVALQDAHVWITPSGGRTPQNTAATTGTTGFELVDGADFTVHVLRVGYMPAQIPVHLRSGCRQTLDVYLKQAPTRIDPTPAPKPAARATFATCPAPA